MTEVDILGQIADLKEVDYKTNLVLSSFIELLCDKNIINKQELLCKIQALDLVTELEIRHANKNL
ncbi:hypothetical protein [Anaerosinus massiliensis]|uniref:hypothetical protein n=1 Tax=Massilibacillus massiliensis TaxID=1806837 RepID=UPI000DA6327D|nr:hypothetical protein [Massilibacillus massiliensis]